MNGDHNRGHLLSLSLLVQVHLVEVVLCPLFTLNVGVEVGMVLSDKVEDNRWSDVNDELAESDGDHVALV